MMQVIEGKRVYVVEFDTMPELPITGRTEEEKIWNHLLNSLKLIPFNGMIQGGSMNGIYAKALTNAIETGIITEPGKYGIHVEYGGRNYTIYKIVEE